MTESLRHVLTLVLWDADPRSLGDACEFLEVAVPGGFGSRELQAMLAYAGDDADRLVTACLAVAIAEAERRLTADKPQPGGTQLATLHGAFLAATGVHELTDAERALIAERGLPRERPLVTGAGRHGDPGIRAHSYPRSPCYWGTRFTPRGVMTRLSNSLG